jgi:hypothetical protein
LPTAIELPVGIQVFGFEVAIHRFSTRARGASPRRRLDHDEWGVVLLRHFRRR